MFVCVCLCVCIIQYGGLLRFQLYIAYCWGPGQADRVALRRLLRVFYANQMKLNLYFYAHAQGASTTAKITTGETRATQAARR